MDIEGFGVVVNQMDCSKNETFPTLLENSIWPWYHYSCFSVDLIPLALFYSYIQIMIAQQLIYNSVYMVTININVEPASKTNHLGVRKLLWKCAICLNEGVQQIAHFHSKLCTYKWLLLLGGYTNGLWRKNILWYILIMVSVVTYILLLFVNITV